MAGTSSGAGKSLFVTGLCRLLARQGLTVAPFKAQNMSNNSMVCADGSEIGRAQYLQAQAAGVEPESAMNPVLLKPGSDHKSFVVLRGRPQGTLSAGQFAAERDELAKAAFAAYEELAARFELIICEGAGSPAEINLRSSDYVNLGLARHFGLPVVIIGDIDRGGAFAALYGTVALLEHADQALIRTFVINKFRGEPAILQPGLQELTARTGVPFAGVLPWLPDIWLDAEDSLDAGRWPADHGAVDHALRIAVVRLPRMSNITDIDALAAEPGVDVMLTTDAEVVANADLAIVPGTRSTVRDLTWLRARRIDLALASRAKRAAPVLGICGGYQMLATTIDDPIESRCLTVEGIGLLPAKINFSADKVLGRPTGSWLGHDVRAYEIHHGIAEVHGEAEAFLDGCRVGQVWGTMWHGTLENDAFRRAWLTEVAETSASAWRPVMDAPSFASRRESMINTMADAIERHVDLELIIGGVA